jgi:hypothetical protein
MAIARVSATVLAVIAAALPVTDRAAARAATALAPAPADLVVMVLVVPAAMIVAPAATTAVLPIMTTPRPSAR